jgi:hypothetical protein
MMSKLRQNIVKQRNKQTAVIISENMLHFGIMMVIMFMLEVKVGGF